jgi:hypothetical protein
MKPQHSLAKSVVFYDKENNVLFREKKPYLPGKPRACQVLCVN